MMADEKQLSLLKQGANVWNKWREKNRQAIIDGTIKLDLSGADFKGAILDSVVLFGADLRGADLSNADLGLAHLGNADLTDAKLRDATLYGVDFSYSILDGTDLRGADLNGAYFIDTNLSHAQLTGAILSETNLSFQNFHNHDLRGTTFEGANLTGTNLSNADLSGSNLSRALLIDTNFSEANISDCYIFGISAWNLTLTNAIQSNLTITKIGEPPITIDNLEIAQFVYLVLNNPKLRDIIDTIGKKAVLILGRFKDERKTLLDKIREELRKRDYVPILFDFEQPSSRDLTETVMTLAGLSRFVIADLSDPNSIPHELMSFVEKLLSVPVQPIFCPVLEHKTEYRMFEHLARYPHVLPIYQYESKEKLIAALEEKVLKPVEAKIEEMKLR